MQTIRNILKALCSQKTKVLSATILFILVGASVFVLIPHPTAHAFLDDIDVTSIAKAIAGASVNPFSIFNLANPAEGFGAFLLQLIGNTILGMMSLLVWLAGKMLDGAMYMTVHMADEILPAIPIVDFGWKVFRDLANIVFIFILLYSAIAMILNMGNARRLIIDVIITALLINFSLFITKAVVDVSNVIALQFYDAIQVSNAVNDANEPTWLRGPSGAFMQGLQIQTVYNAQKSAVVTPFDALVGGGAKTLAEGSKFITVTFFGSVIMLIAAFIFATGAFLLLLRIVVLIFLMMISPLAFVARILPNTASGWNKWWSTLINNAIFAPAYFAMTYIVIKTASQGLTGVTTLGLSQASFSALFAGVPSSMGLLLNYAFIIILMVMTIGISKALGVYGSNTVMNWGKGISGWARTRGRDIGGWAFRRTVGETARRWEDRAKFSNFGTTPMGRFLRERTIQPLSKTKFGTLSAEEQYKEDRKLEEAHETAKTKGDVLAKVREVATPGSATYIADARERARQIENEVSKLTPKEFAAIPRKQLLQNKELLQYASSAQRAAALSGDWSESEKKQAIRMWLEPHTTAIADFHNRINAYLKQKEAFEQTQLALSKGQPPPLQYQKYYDPTFDPSKAPKLDANTNDFLRGLTPRDLEQIHQVNPELYADEHVAPIFRYSAVDTMRSSEWASRGEKEIFRDTKNYGIAAAADAAVGIDAYNDEFMRYDIGTRNNLRKAIESYVAANPGAPVGTVTPDGKVVFNYAGKDYVIAASRDRQEVLRNNADRMAIESLGGRSLDEVAKMPGRIKWRPGLMKFYSRAELGKMSMDKEDYIKPIGHILKAYETEKAGGARMTDKNRDALKWMLSVKEGQNFLRGADLTPALLNTVEQARSEPDSFWKPTGIGPAPTPSGAGGGTPPGAGGGTGGGTAPGAGPATPPGGGTPPGGTGGGGAGGGTGAGVSGATATTGAGGTPATSGGTSAAGTGASGAATYANTKQKMKKRKRNKNP